MNKRWNLPARSYLLLPDSEVRSPIPTRTVDSRRVAGFLTRELTMFSHIMIGARDLETMVSFFDDVLAPLDPRRVVELEDVAGVIRRKRERRWPRFALRRPINGLRATCYLDKTHDPRLSGIVNTGLSTSHHLNQIKKLSGKPIATTPTAIFSDGERTYSLSVVKADFITAL
ncbi:hypothetical protein EHI48_27190 [Rhizobium sp. WSM1325]|nr:hypothetical protein EHI48_27190 [Rhizobium leguminosarum]